MDNVLVVVTVDQCLFMMKFGMFIGFKFFCAVIRNRLWLTELLHCIVLIVTVSRKCDVLGKQPKMLVVSTTSAHLTGIIQDRSCGATSTHVMKKRPSLDYH